MRFTTTLLTALTASPLLALASALPYSVDTLANTPTADLELRTNAAPYCPPRPASAAHQRRIFNAMVDTLYIQKDVPRAFNDYWAVDYLEHDPFDPQGRAANSAKLTAVLAAAPTFHVLRTGFDNNLGWVMVKVDQKPDPVAIADIFRMNGTCIVEHWDIAQIQPFNRTNPVDMF
ncbi:hypothetical protein MMC16_003390 [Acarospora aff. strigata]|nr:hypothetical protein [Acarospora aff. strigata]